MAHPTTRLDTTTTRASDKGVRAKKTRALVWMFFVIAGVSGAIISWGFLSESLAALGIKDPGFLTTAGLPFMRSGGLMLAALSSGSFLFSSFLTPPLPTKDGNLLYARLDVDGTLAARTGCIASASFGLVSLLLVPLYLSDVSGEPISYTIQPKNWPVAIDQVSTSLAFFAVAIICFVTAIGGIVSTRWVFQPLALFGSIMQIVPLGLEGHSAAGGDHDYGVNSYLFHLLFFVLWVGGLMALIAHGRRKGTHMDLAVRRYSSIALVSIIGMAISGIINAAIRIHWGDWFTTGYGLLIVGKTAGVIVLAFFGWWHRAATIPKIAAHPNDDRYFRRVAIGEVAVMAAVTGLAISLSRTPPPPPISPDINAMDIEIGYKLYHMPTLWNVWTMWRYDLVFGTLAIVTAFAYIWGVMRLKEKNIPWSGWKTFWFLSGSAVLLLTMCSGIGMNMPAMFSMHMIGHMILTMGVPVLWVLGAPFTLWLAALKPGTPEIPGPKEWLQVFVNNPALRLQMTPWFDTIQFVVLFYILYLTPLYDYAVTQHAGHLSMNIIFLWSGYIYYWELIGLDGKPVERTPMSRCWWLVVSMPFHLFFGVVLMEMNHILAEDFYTHLGLPFHVNLLHDQNVGGGIAWASGQFPLLIIFGAVFIQWYRYDKKQALAYDAHADQTNDEDMANYNKLLASLAQGKATDDLDDYYEKPVEKKPAPHHKRRFGFGRAQTKGSTTTPPKKFTEMTEEEFAQWEADNAKR